MDLGLGGRAANVADDPWQPNCSAGNVLFD